MALLSAVYLKIMDAVAQDEMRQHVIETKRAEQFGVRWSCNTNGHGRLNLALYPKIH